MKKKHVLIVLAILMASVLCLLSYETLLKDEKIDSVNKDSLAIYIQNSSGSYVSSSDTKLPTDGYTLNTSKSSCTSGATLTQDSNTKTVALSTAKNDKCTLYFDVVKTTPPVNVANVIKAAVKSGSPNFGSIASTDEGVYKAADNDGTSYYFRGAVTNNYVKYAGFYWRIIRLNGDGTLRIMYDGTSAHANGVAASDRTVTSTPSSWYKTNITDAGYSSNVVNEIFCSDTITYNEEDISDGGMSGTVTYYTSYERLVDNKNPTLKCSSSTKSSVGSITADEVALAGGVYNTSNTSYYLNKNAAYLTNTIALTIAMGMWGGDHWMGDDPEDQYFGVESSGSLKDSGSSTAYAPVINLSASYISSMTGSGTMSDPYTK